MRYGNYVATDRNGIQKAKDELLESLIDTIQELAKRDDFWIVKEFDESVLLNPELRAKGKNTTVGWKIDIPHMGEGKPIQVIVNGEVVGELARGQ